MTQKGKGIKKYYGLNGKYLKEHTVFLKEANVEQDINFIIQALNLNKHHQILDIACGQGRHVHALARRGYKVDGVDFSEYLLALANKSSDRSIKVLPTFYKSDVMKLKLNNKFDRAYWFFSDLAEISPIKALSSISENLVIGSRLLLDTDNVFRLLNFLRKNVDSGFVFDAERLELIDGKNGLIMPYPVLPMWKFWLAQSGFSVVRVIGDYQFGAYNISSPRLILIVKKIA